MKLIPGQFRQYVSMDVSLWLECRKFDNQEPLREEHGFVIINNELEKELDDFKSEFIKGSIWIPEHDLLWHWYNVNNDCPDVVKKFGGTYFRLTQQTLDTLFTWMMDTKEQASRMCIITIIIVQECSSLCHSQYLL